MSFSTITGGFEVSAEDRLIVNKQRAITKAVNDQFIQVGAIWLKTSGKMPIDADWTKGAYRDTDLQSWIDDPSLFLHNVGFNLQFGWMDIDIDADDPDFNACMIAALNYNGVDTRFQFGRRAVGYPTHVLVQLGEEESSSFAELSRFEPKEFRIDGKRYHTQLRSYSTNIDAKNVAREAKQTVVPGSIYLPKKEGIEYDMSVWYTQEGKIAGKVQNIATTTPRRVSYNQVLRSIAFATFLYVIKDYWVEGQRQTTVNKVAGWLARVVKDGQAMNNHEAISEDVFCPVDSDDIAESLLSFVADELGDDEKHMRIRSYNDARDKLERNSDAKIPGWPALEALVGPARVNALRTVFTPGSDVSILTKMAEQYAYDDTDNLYIDRKRHENNFEGFVHEAAALERRHIDEVVVINGKPRAAFKMYETSKMRVRVTKRDLFPDQHPGSIFRVNRRGEVLSDDDTDPSGSMVFNTWRGWPIGVPERVDKALLEQCRAYLDRLLDLLTSDNKEQGQWAQKWLAWTFQHPAVKQQIAWVCVGGQGVGKSFMGNTFMSALMGALWGSASSNVISDKFNIGPFINKMMVFVDEAKFHNEAGTEEVKRLIRNVDVAGRELYVEGRNYKIYSRMFFASNTFDMAIGQKSVIDRALFYTKAYSAQHMGITDSEFRAWSETLKPWFTEFDQFLKRMDVKEHFMHHFMTMEVTKEEVESIKLSSSQDADITGANMRPSRRIAKFIVEEGRILEDTSTDVPFTPQQLSVRVNEVCETLIIRPVRLDLIIAEFAEAGVIDKIDGKLVFKWREATLIEKFGEAISMKLDTRWQYTDADRGPNTEPPKGKPWKGNRLGVVASHKGI